MAIETGYADLRLIQVARQGDRLAALAAALGVQLTTASSAPPSTPIASAPNAAPTTIDVKEFDRDAAQVTRVVKGDLSTFERQQLLVQQHPILGQLADPHTKPLVELFASLSADEHRQGQQAGYLKWKYAELSPERQQVYRDALQVNLDMAKANGGELPTTYSMEALDDAEVGFANVDITEKNARVCSWYILLPEHPAPIWVTVVNAKYAGTPEYFAAHHAQLSALRLKPTTGPAPQAASKPVANEPAPEADDPDAVRLLQLAEEDLASALKLHAAGAASNGAVREEQVEVLKAKITLACGRQQRDELARLFDELIALREAELEDQKKLREAGAASEAAVRSAERRVLKERELKQAALDSLE